MTKFKQAHTGLRLLALGIGILILAGMADRAAWTNQKPTQSSADLQSPLAAYGAEAVSIDPASREFKTPEQFEWKGRPASASQAATLFGDSAKAGMYVQLLKRGPDDWSTPHSHPNDRFITVLAGTFKIGTGAKLDKNNTVSLGPGSVVKDIANQMHFDGTGPEGVTLEIIGMGPATAVRN